MNPFSEENRVLTLKRLAILLAAIVVIFAAINAIWYFGYYQRYHILSSQMESYYQAGIEEESFLRYSMEVGDYTVTLKMPSYLSSSGFITIEPSEGYTAWLDEDGNIVESTGMLVTLYIWPEYFVNYEVGLWFYDDAAGISYQVTMTSDMEIARADEMDNALVEEIQSLISEHQDEIDALLRVAADSLDIHLGEY
ncbi:MAG: hypothetical protein LUJ09_08235 [Firmicutes bacterium]|nr:hypothetical protein [Bacillota bacterium]